MSVDRERVAAALPSYEIGEEIGRGGWGIVREGRHRRLDRQVAIKQLPPSLSGDPSVRERFAAEARVLASLDHPHIVPVFDFVEADGLCLLVMEKLPGGTVWSRFTTTGLTPETSCALVLATCSGLQAAHDRGVLHRDIKPENLLFASSGNLKVADFGIAKVVGNMQTLATQAGEVLGTPAYMAPEQARGGELGPQTDVYAVATMLYELLSGRLPFPDDADPLTVLYRHAHEAPQPLNEVAPNIPGDIVEVVMKGLATEPDDRYPTAESFGVALARAATAVWMPGWPESRGRIVVLGSSKIVSATEQPSGSLVAVNAAPAPPTVIVGEISVRPSTSVKQHKPPPLQADNVVLVPVKQMVSRPPFPARAAGTAALLLGLALVVGLLGIGSPGYDTTVPEGSVRVAGQEITGGVVNLNLDDPLEVAISGSALQPAPDAVRFDLELLGIRLGTSTEPLTAGPDGRLIGATDLSGSRLLVPGAATGSLSLLSGGSVIADQSFGLRSSRSALLTVPGFASIAALLFLAAYAESVLKTLRRGRRVRSGRAALVILGTFAGFLLALVGSFLRTINPGFAALIAAAILGGASGYFGGKAGAQIGRYRGRKPGANA
jgi:serine/threonine protein kinase